MKKRIFLGLLCFLLLLGLTGCGTKNGKQDEKKLVTTGISTAKADLDIQDGKIVLPEFERTIINQKTNETSKKIIDNKKLKFLNSKNEELIAQDNVIVVPNEDDMITVIYKESDKEFKTTIHIHSMKKYIIFGNSTLYYGKYKAEGDLPSEFNGFITINSDKTATHVGSKFNDNNGRINEVNLTGVWEVRAESIGGLQGSLEHPSSVDGIFFVWNNGSKDSYGVGTKYFGNQFMGYRWISE